MISVHSLALADPKRRPRHPLWLHANEIRHIDDTRLESHRCALVRFEGRLGIYHKDSLLAVRMLAPSLADGNPGDSVAPEAFVATLAELLRSLRSWKIRHFPFARSQAFRWSHGDSDGIPGIVIDDYQSFLVIQSGCAAGDFLVEMVAAALMSLDSRPVLERSTGQVRAMEGLPERTRWLRKPEEDAPVLVPFAGISLSFDPMRAQKTGLFLDQRSNLETFATLIPSLQSKSILDICCYAGAWSAVAAAHGLSDFTLVDADARALAMAEKNVRSNATVSDARIESRHGDLFEALAKEKQSGRLWDVVVADPPAFAKSRKHIPEATQAYARLIRQAARLVSPGGLLVACSCSRNMEAATFEELAFRQLGAGEWLLVKRGQQSPDHTIAADGSDYLKCLFFLKRGPL